MGIVGILSLTLLLFPIPSFGLGGLELLSYLEAGNVQKAIPSQKKDVELSLPDDPQKSAVSIFAARSLLGGFFSKLALIDIERLVYGGNENLQYGVATMKTVTGDFRIFYLLKDQKLRQLLIDKIDKKN